MFKSLSDIVFVAAAFLGAATVMLLGSYLRGDVPWSVVQGLAGDSVWCLGASLFLALLAYVLTPTRAKDDDDDQDGDLKEKHA